MTEVTATGDQWTGNQWTIHSGSLSVAKQINHRPRCLKNISTTLQISKLPSIGNSPLYFHAPLHPLAAQATSLPSVWLQVPCVVPRTGDPGVLVCLLSRGVPTPPHCGSLLGAGAPAPHRDLLSPAQGWGWLGGMAVPSGFPYSKASIDTF